MFYKRLKYSYHLIKNWGVYMSDINVLFVSSEAAPFIKTGGLADVSAALPKALKKGGIDVRLVVPLYSLIDKEGCGLKKLFDGCCVKMGNCEEWYSVYINETTHNYPVYFIEFNKYFERNGVYDDKNTHEAYYDNAFRYAFFNRAALQLAKDLNFRPDIVHVHDWQTCLIPYYLKKEGDPFFQNTKSILTIHNLPYQGIYPSDVVPYAKVDWADFNMNAFEHYGQINFLKGGIRFADKITTVSPNYAKEIVTPLGGAGLFWLLNERRSDLSGILNGIDTDLWNPMNDKNIAYPYDLESFKKGKEANKKALREHFGLAQNDSPVFSMVIRLTEQKGIRMFTECIENVLQNMQAQMIVMGDGEVWAEAYLGNLPNYYAGQISVSRFNSSLEHLIDAGSDFTIVPSIYEPCGLKQMYSQLYGTLPIVRATGGLADTVVNYDEMTGLGTGFKFYDIAPSALYNTIGWANATYYDRPEHIAKMTKMAMGQDFSWNRSAKEYLNLYREVKV